MATHGTDLYIAGIFDLVTATGDRVTHIAKWSSMSRNWSQVGDVLVDFSENLPPATDPRFNALLVIENTLYVGGYFAGGVRSFNMVNSIWTDAANGVQCNFCPSVTTAAGFPFRVPEIMTLSQLPMDGPVPPTIVAPSIVETPVDLTTPSLTFAGLGIPVPVSGLLELYENRSRGEGSWHSALGLEGTNFISWQVWAIVGAAVIVLAMICGIVTNVLCRAVARI
jgi:hypothetical protein